MSGRFLCPDLPAPGELRRLDRQVSHHLLEVCRHPRGERLVLFDGAGREATCHLVDVAGGRATVEGLSQRSQGPPPVQRTLLLALCRGPAWETALRMATELGATDVLPVVAARSNLRAGNLERWRRIAAAACEQCGRGWLPRIQGPQPLADALADARLGAVRLVAEPGAPPLPCPAGDVALLVGPEGGLTAGEVAEARAAAFQPFGLGEHVLRVDTAVAAALARILG